MTVSIQYIPEAVIPQSSDGIVSAVISEIDVNNSVIYFNYSEIGADRLVLDEQKDYKIYLDNKDIPIEDLFEGDIISIAYDTSVDFDESDKYTIYVSRNMIEGKLINTDYTSYPPVYDTDSYQLDSLFETEFELETNTSYTFYLDVFGRVVNIECLGEWGIKTEYGILDSVSCDKNRQYYAEIIALDGSGIKTIPLYSEYLAKQASGIIYNECYDDFYRFTDGIPIYKFEILNEGTKQPVNKRCIQYALNRSGKVAKIFVPKKARYPKDAVYNSNSHTLGDEQLDTEHTVIMDFSEYNKIGTHRVLKEAELTDGKTYTYISIRISRTIDNKSKKCIIIY